MKQNLCCVVTPLIIAAASTLHLPVRADNLSACGAVMCLYGQASGQGGGSACDPYLQPYYSIQVFTHGFYDPSKTLDARKAFLEQCSSADAQAIAIANHDGAQQGRPRISAPEPPPSPHDPNCGDALGRWLANARLPCN